MAFNYARIRDIIGQRVDQFAQDAILRTPPSNDGFREATGNPVDLAIRVVDKKNVVVQEARDEGNVAVRERHVIILNDGGVVPEPTRDQKIVISGEELSIARVMDVNPAGTSLVYTCVIEE